MFKNGDFVWDRQPTAPFILQVVSRQVGTTRLSTCIEAERRITLSTS